MRQTTLLVLLLCTILLAAQNDGSGGINTDGLGGGNQPVKPTDKEEAKAPVVVTFKPVVDAGLVLGNDSTALYVLYSYARKNNPTIETYDDLKTYLDSNNPLLAQYFKENLADSKWNFEDLKGVGYSVSTGGILENFGSKKFIDGLGLFLAERFREELTIRYLEQLQEAVRESESEFKRVLPATTNVILNADVFRLSNYLKTLRDAFRDDLHRFPESMPDLAMNHPSFKSEDLKYLLLYDVVRSYAMEGYNPLTYLEGIEENKFVKRSSQQDFPSVERNYFSAVRLSRIVYQLFKVESTDGLMGTLDDLKTPESAMIVLGLLAEKERKILTEIKFGEKTALSCLFQLTENASFIFLTDSYNLVRSIHEDVINTEGENNVSEKFMRAEAIIQGMHRLINHQQSLAGESLQWNQPEIVLALLTTSRYIAEEKYGLAVSKAMDVFKETGISETSEFYQSFKKYGMFIANVAAADSASQVKEALELAAMPVGSYRVKRASKWDISLNAYPGIFGGHEWYVNQGENIPVDRKAGVLGFTAPVGLAFSLGTKANGKSKGGSSWSAFFSVIDVGAVTAFRLSNDASEDLPDLKWKNFIAPGAYVIHGFQRTPLSLGAGVQYGPQVRKIADLDQESLMSAMSVRLMLVVDVPLLNLQSRGRD